MQPPRAMLYNGGLVAMLIIAVIGGMIALLVKKPPPPPVAPKAVKSAPPIPLPPIPFRMPPGATVTSRLGTPRDHIVYTIWPAPELKSGRRASQLDMIRGCHQWATSIPGWRPSPQRHNFTHITGQCLGWSFARPARPVDRDTECALELMEREALAVVTDCVVDGVYVISIAVSQIDFPHSVVSIGVPYP